MCVCHIQVIPAIMLKLLVTAQHSECYSSSSTAAAAVAYRDGATELMPSCGLKSPILMFLTCSCQAAMPSQT